MREVSTLSRFAHSLCRIFSSIFRKYDILIGGIHADYLNSSKFMASSPYLQDDLTWCVSRASEIPRWKNLYYIVKDAKTFIWGITMFIMVIITAYLWTTFEEKPLDIFYCTISSVQILVGFTSTFRPKGWLLRFHYGQFLVIPFWTSQIFSAFLTTFTLRTLYEYQIDTIEDIARDGFRLAGDPHAFIENKVSL